MGEGAAKLRFVVLGAGMAGILAGIKLREAGYGNVAIYEKADRLGGTWRENTYPGLTCDVPAHTYSYVFEPNPEWSQQLAPGPEIQAYLERVAERHDLHELFRFNQEVVRCAYDGQRWQLQTQTGLRDEADFVIAATGVLHHPRYPEIAGLESFEGALFHSARWDHDVPLDGQRIGIVGNGSTGVQLVSELAGRARELYQFQRTAQWIMPARNRRFSEEDKARFRADPELPRRKLASGASGALFERFNNAIVDPESEDMQEMERIVLENLEQSVRDPVLLEKLRPSYRVMCKRLVYSPDYYEAIQHPNAELVTDGIERVEPGGVRTREGRLIELDVLVLATGFRVDQFMRPMQIIGRGGVGLEDFWAVRPRAYLSISMPDFPNLFMLNGPNGPVGNLSLIEVAERQWEYISRLIGLVASGRCREVSVSREAMHAFDTDRIKAAKTTVWATGCSSWYLDAEGVPASWPWSYDRFKDEMDAPRLEHFELVV